MAEEPFASTPSTFVHRGAPVLSSGMTLGPVQPRSADTIPIAPQRRTLGCVGKERKGPPPVNEAQARCREATDLRKGAKIATIPEFKPEAPSDRIKTYTEEELDSEPIFFKYKKPGVGTKLNKYRDKDGSWTVEFNETTMHIPTVGADGSQFYDPVTGELVYRLLPRETFWGEKAANEMAKRINGHEYTTRNMDGTERGSSHACRTEFKYVILGAQTRMQGGVSETYPPNRSVESPFEPGVVVNPFAQYQRIRKKMENRFKEYVESVELRALEKLHESENTPKTNIISSMAYSNDFSAAAHTNKDYDLACLIIMTFDLDGSKSKEERVRFNLEEDPPPSTYIPFPTFGVAVPVRPGDMLIFNPLAYNCASEKTEEYQNHRVKACTGWIYNTILTSPEQQESREHNSLAEGNRNMTKERACEEEEQREHNESKTLGGTRRVEVGGAAPGVRKYTVDELKSNYHYFKYVPVGTKELETKREADRSITVEFNETTMLIPPITEEGSQAIDERTGQLLYRLLPRTKVPTTPATVEREANAIHAHEHCLRNMQGTKRCRPHRCRTDYKYVILGAKAFPGGVSQTSVPEGIVTSPFDPEFQVDAELHVDKVQRRMETSFREYLSSDELRGLQTSLASNAPNSNFSYMACTNDFASAAHVETDLFLSTIHIKAYLMDDTQSPEERVRCNLAENPDPAMYFVLPTDGLAVPLRPGDTLIFNPLIYHCESEKTAEYANYRVKEWAAYTKNGGVDLGKQEDATLECNNKMAREEPNEETSKQGRFRHDDR